MTAFFVKTEQSSAGPFTGVELREAALAGIVGPQTQIGGGPRGPWMKAADVGLFSDKKLPLPHPPGTAVPQFQVRGLQGALTGPFKLRELIGFAARGMLPLDAMLKSDMSPEWISLQRIPVLSACLSGQLVLLGEQGKVHLRTRSGNGDAKTAAAQDAQARAPVQSAGAIDITTSAAHRHQQTEAQPELIIVGDDGLVIDEEEQPVSPAEAMTSQETEETGDSPRRRLRLPAFRFAIPVGVGPRLVVNALCLLLAVAGIGAAYAYWRNIGMDPNAIIGEWIGGGDSGIPCFGISFRQDRNCVVFNTQGESWSGDYTWATRTDDAAGFEQLEPFSSDVDKLDASYQSGPVQPTDGYIRLRGHGDHVPVIGGHRVGDCFLRRDGENLRIGYLTNVTWTRTAKSMNAGWMTLRPLKANRGADIIADLMSMDSEDPPVSGYFVEKSPHLSKAVAALRNSQDLDALDGDVGNGSTCFSVRVNAEYLLRTYGVPDEARPVYPFEIPQLSIGQSFEGSQIVRYGVLKLFVRPDGTIQYVSIML